MLLGWRDVVEGIFEVQRRDGNAIVAVNLIDELTYRVYSNMGPSVFAQMPPGSFAIARLVPVGDVWVLSGAAHVWPASERATMQRIAADAALRHPAKVFRNPDKLARGRELRKRKPAYFTKPALPSVIPRSEALSKHVRPDRPSRRARRRTNPSLHSK